MGKRNIKKPAVFLDRDGTIIFDKHYLRFPKQVKVYSFAAAAINKLRAAGFKIIVVTNQSGIGRGMFSQDDYEKVNKRFIRALKEKGAKVDAVYHCPHVDEDRCSCRKPAIGMAVAAAKKFNIALDKSYAVGDSARDVELGFIMGAKGIMVLTGHGKKQRGKIKNSKIKPLAVCKNLEKAADFIIEYEKNN
jgi:histidinol-phosphate phosphatase family protein